MFHCFSFATGMREARGWGGSAGEDLAERDDGADAGGGVERRREVFRPSRSASDRGSRAAGSFPRGPLTGRPPPDPPRSPCRCGFAPGIRRGSWGTQDGTAGRRSCLNAVFRALYVAEENYEVRTRKTHTGLGGNAILRFSSGNSGRKFIISGQMEFDLGI